MLIAFEDVVRAVHPHSTNNAWQQHNKQPTKKPFTYLLW